MVGALVYMHSRYSAARDIYEAQLEEDEDNERQVARAQPSTSTTGPKYSQVWQLSDEETSHPLLSLIPLPVVYWPRKIKYLLAESSV